MNRGVDFVLKDEKYVSKSSDTRLKQKICASITKTPGGYVTKFSILPVSKDDHVNRIKLENSSSTTAVTASKNTNADTRDEGKVPRIRLRKLSISNSEVESNDRKVAEGESTSSMDADDVSEKEDVVEVNGRRLKRKSTAPTGAEVSEKQQRTTPFCFTDDVSTTDEETEGESSDGTTTSSSSSDEETADENMPRKCVAEIINDFEAQLKIVGGRFGVLVNNLETDLKAIAQDRLNTWMALRELSKLVSNPCFDIKEYGPAYEKRRLMLKTEISTMKEPNFSILHDLSLSLRNAIPSLCCLLSELEVSCYNATKSEQKDMNSSVKYYNKGYVPDKIKKPIIVKPFKDGVLWKRTDVKKQFYSFFKAGFGGNGSTEVGNKMDVPDSKSQPNVARNEEPVTMKEADVEPVTMKEADIETVTLKEADVEPVTMKEADVEPATVEISAAEYIYEELFDFQTEWCDNSFKLHVGISKLHKEALESSMKLIVDGDVVHSTNEMLDVVSRKILGIEELLKSLEEHCDSYKDVIKRFEISKQVNCRL